VISLALVCAGQCAALAQDWPQWRGPGRDGVVSASGAPVKWPESLKKGWQVEVGEGYSSPVLSGGRIFVHSRHDPDETVMAIDRSTGNVIWQKKYSAPFTKQTDAAKMAKGPHATPLVVGKRLFTVGASAIVTAWDTATGDRLWSNDYSKTVDSSKLFCGTSASPMMANGNLIIQAGSDIHGGNVIALDPATGNEKWNWLGPGPGYASPISIVTGGKTHIVTLTEKSIVGIDAANGHLLWEAPFPDTWNENIVTPIWTGTHLIISGTRRGTHGYTLKESGGAWQATEVWKTTEVEMYMSSPVYGDGLLFGHSTKQRGQFVALNAATGNLKWQSEGRDGDQASVLLTPRSVVYLTNGGDLIVASRTAPKYALEKRYKVSAAETWASPILAGSDLYVRDTNMLTHLSLE